MASRMLTAKLKTKPYHEVLKEVKDKYRYDMSSSPRGYCVIISITTDFHAASKDEELMSNLFKELFYEIKIIRDKTHKEIEGELKDIAASIPSEHQSVIVILTSHGNQLGDQHVFFDKPTQGRKCGEPQTSSYIFDAFDAKNCQALMGRPKAFIFDTCHGPEPMRGVRAKGGPGSLPIVTEVAHVQSDFLIYRATLKGHTSFAAQDGSLVIKAIDRIFREHSADRDLLQLLTMVNGEVATEEYSSYTKQGDLVETEYVWQQPLIERVTFAKLFYFHPGFYDRTAVLLPGPGINN